MTNEMIDYILAAINFGCISYLLIKVLLVAFLIMEDKIELYEYEPFIVFFIMALSMAGGVYLKSTGL